MSLSWYFVKDGQRNGPMRREELDARIAEGAVDGGTLVWRPGLAVWEKACAVPELGLPPPVPPPPLPPPAPRMHFNYAPMPAAEESAPAAAAAPAPNFAGFRVRLAAKCIDWVVLYGIGTLVQHVAIATAFDGVAPTLSDWHEFLRLAVYTVPVEVAIALLYTVYFVAKHEGTPGKRILGLRVVRADGGRLRPGRTAARFFAEFVSRATFLAGYVMAAFDEEKRTLHDYMCDTRVVRGPREDGR